MCSNLMEYNRQPDVTLKASHLSLLSDWNYKCVLPCTATVSVCASVYMCTCGGRRSTSGVVPEDPSILLIETGCLTRTWNSPVRLGWPVREPQLWDYKCVPPHLAFLCGFWGLNSGLHICSARTLPSQLSSHPFYKPLMRRPMASSMSCTPGC